MSKLTYYRQAKTLLLLDRENHQVGAWPAGNNVDSHVGLTGLPNGNYRFQTNSHRGHGSKKGDTSVGPYGPMGIFLLKDFFYRGTKHFGVGIHSGRKYSPDGRGRSGTEHATLLCVRTTDVAMSMIYLVSIRDPLQTLTVQDGAPEDFLVHTSGPTAPNL